MNFITLKTIRNNSFARNSLILFAGTMVINIVNYFFHLSIARMVSVEIYGEFESLNSLLMIISVPAAALTMLATKYSAHAKAENDPAQTHNLMTFLNKKVFLWLVPAIVLMFFLTPTVSIFLKIDNYSAIVLFWIIILLSFASAVNGGIINGWQKFKDASWIGILGAFIKIFSAIFLVKIGLQLNGIIGGFILSILITYLLTFYVLRFIFKNYRQNKISSGKNLDFKSMKAYVVPVLFGNLALTVFGNIDMVLAKHNLSAEVAGQYGALTIVSKIIFFATGIIGTVLFSMAAEKNHRDGNALPILKNAIWLIAIICLFSVLAYFSVPKLIMGMLFGSRYADTIGYLGWFAILASLFSLVNLITQYLLSVHATRFVTSYLILAGFLCVWILVAGSQIFAILKMMIAGEVMALILGFYYLKKQSQQYAKIDLTYNPNL